MIKKLDSIQILRGIAAVAVVLYHMRIIEKKYSGGDLLLPYVFKVGQSGVDLFFAISGFIMVTITREKWGGEVKTSEFLLRRFARIYPNYWFYLFLTLAVFLFQPSLVNSSQGHHFNFLCSFLLIPTDTLPLVLVGWSLIYEVYFYLIFATLIQFKKRLIILLLIIWLLILFIINYFYSYQANAIIRLLVSPYSIEFILGAFSALLVCSKRVLRLPLAFFICIIVAIVLLIPYLFFRFYTENVYITFLQSLVFGGVFSLLIIAFVAVEKKTNIRFPKFLVTVGDVSYTIYLSHVLILGALGRLWAAYFQTPFSIWDNLIIFPLMLCVIITYSVIAFRLIELPLYNFFIKKLSKKKKAVLA